jgi:hypothetical protein
MQPNDVSPAQSAPQSSDETVEIELTAEEQLWLSRAGNAAAEETSCADKLASHSQRPVGDNSLWMRTARVDAICTVTFAVVVLCIVAASLQHTAVPHAGTLAATPVAQVPPLSAASEPQRPPVQVRNPFDRSEVFELPADTTEDAARAAVAELLLERARSRLHNPSVASTRIMGHGVDGTTGEPPEIFVTQVSTSFR